MSKTDKTKPAWVRLREAGAAEYDYLYRGLPTFYIPNDFKWSHHERGVGPKEARYAKRMRAKKNRRRKVPLQQMRGHGWGEENMHSW